MLYHASGLILKCREVEMNYLMKAVETIDEADSYDRIQGKLAQAYLTDAMQELVDELEGTE